MKSTTRIFIEPLDVLFLRGNKLFGDPGSYGESFMPPRPSVVAGALRSGLIANRGYDPQKFGNGEITEDSELGTPNNPGTFILKKLNLAKREEHQEGYLHSPLYSLPADLLAKSTENDDDAGVKSILRLRPRFVTKKFQDTPQILTSNKNITLPVLADGERSKYLNNSHLYLNSDGWDAYLREEQVVPEKHLVHSSDLWQMENRIGIGLDADRGTADESAGKLFTTQAVSLRRQERSDAPYSDVGLIAEVSGATFPNEMIIRLGGDGRGALAKRVSMENMRIESNGRILERIVEMKKCRLILTTPGIFPCGWNIFDSSCRNGEVGELFDGVIARIECATIPRYEVVSGFDISKSQPKPALRAVPTGSVYWLTELNATVESLANAIEEGLWQSSNKYLTRKVEGFNRFELGIYGEN